MNTLVDDVQLKLCSVRLLWRQGRVSKLHPADPGARENEHSCRGCAGIVVLIA